VDATKSIIECLEQSGVNAPAIELTIAQYLHLQRVSQLVMMMCRRAEEGDFDQLNALYAERDSVVNTVIRARESLRPLALEAATRKRVNGFFDPVVRAINMWDARLLAILQEKKRSIVEKSKEAQLRRLVLKYST
jgi:hypothetical protein